MNKLKHNSLIRFHCARGKALKGPKKSVCKNGKWSVVTFPKCVAREAKDNGCPDPGVPYYATRTLVGKTEQPIKRLFKTGAIIFYKCKGEGDFKLVGSVTRVCESNGSWSGVAPICEIVYDNTFDGTFGRNKRNGLKDLSWWKEQQEKLKKVKNDAKNVCKGGVCKEVNNNVNSVNDVK